MRIFDNLKQHYPKIKLSALYLPMLNALETGLSHPYTKAAGSKKAGQKIQHRRLGALRDPLAQKMATLCSMRAVDQEIVCEGFHELGLQALDISVVENR